MKTKLVDLFWISTLLVLLTTGCANIGIDHTNPGPSKLKEYLANVVDVLPGGGYCSGWVKKATHEIVTAAHCAEGLADTAVININFGDGLPHPFHIKRRGDAALANAPDLLTLYTNDRTINWPVGFEVCKFAPYYGEELILMGGPLAFSKSLEYGRVGNPDVDVSEVLSGAKYSKHMIEWNGIMWPGNSGGPAVDIKHGCVIGSGELAKLVDSYSSVGVNFFTPMSDLKVIEHD
jgi:S1-C subfamily serine protease